MQTESNSRKSVIEIRKEPVSEPFGRKTDKSLCRLFFYVIEKSYRAGLHCGERREVAGG